MNNIIVTTTKINWFKFLIRETTILLSGLHHIMKNSHPVSIIIKVLNSSINVVCIFLLF